jgi:multiple sugar transport system permease protein
MRGGVWPWLMVGPALVGLLAFRLVPMMIAVAGAFSGTSLLGELQFRGFGNFVALFTDPGFWSSLRVTLLFNLIINPLQLVAALLLALLVFREGPLVRFYRLLFFLPVTVSTALTAVLFGLFLDPNLGPMNGILEWAGIGAQPFYRSPDQALWTLIGVATWKGAGYWMLFLLAGLYAIPDEVREAAQIDGATGLQRFIHVTLPLLKRPMAFVLVADTAINFLFFAPVYILTSGGPHGTTDLLMFQSYQAAFTFLDIGRSLAIATILLLFIAVFAMVELRLFRTET